jgi:hypothetical protein
MFVANTLQVSTIKSMQKYESVFEYLHASFVTNMAIYRNSLEELLSSLSLSDSQLYQLLEDTDESAWESPDLVSGLRDRLGHNYIPFKSSVKQLNKKMILFGHKLQLDDKLKVSFSLYLFSTCLTLASHLGCLILGTLTPKHEIVFLGTP